MYKIHTYCTIMLDDFRLENWPCTPSLTT